MHSCSGIRTARARAPVVQQSSAEPLRPRPRLAAGAVVLAMAKRVVLAAVGLAMARPSCSSDADPSFTLKPQSQIVGAPVGASSVVGGTLQVDGAPFFPVGFYVHDLSTADWEWMQVNGINTVLTYTNGLKSEKTSKVTPGDLAQMGAFLDAAAARKIKVFLSLKDLYDMKNKGVDNAGIVTTIVTAFRNHSALLGWYLNDEYLLRIIVYT